MVLQYGSNNQPTQPTTLILLHTRRCCETRRTRRCGETRWSRENDTLRIAETNRGELQEGRKRKETAAARLPSRTHCGNMNFERKYIDERHQYYVSN